MASKTFELKPLGELTISKRRGNRNLRLSVTPSGQIRVTIPVWATYQAGLDFAHSRQQWILEQLPPPMTLIQGQVISPGYQLRFVSSAAVNKPRARRTGTIVHVTHPSGLDSSHPLVQAAAQSALTRALRAEAKALLPPRLDALARQSGLSYRSVQIKSLRRRWGSCDSRGRIVLNLYLVQLPTELIDYVLLHELAHTRHLNHGQEFRNTLVMLSPDARTLRRQLKQFNPGVIVAGDAARRGLGYN